MRRRLQAIKRTAWGAGPPGSGEFEMGRRSVTALVAACLLALPLRAQVLDETAIRTALTAGTDNKFGAWIAGAGPR
jgi:hypothetical protein